MRSPANHTVIPTRSIFIASLIVAAIPNTQACGHEPKPPQAIALAPASASAPANPSAPASASASSTPPTTPIQQKYIVAAVGDSITDTRSHGGKFLSYLRERCPTSQFDNYGRGGEMVNQMRHRFAREVTAPEQPRYTHVIIFGGVNDVYSDLTAHRTPLKIENDLQSMYTMAHEANIKVIGMAIAPWGGFRRYFNPTRSAATLEINKWIEQQHVEGKIEHFVDTYSLLSCGEPEKLCPDFTPPFNDGIHFNALGHDKIGEVLYNSVFADCL